MAGAYTPRNGNPPSPYRSEPSAPYAGVPDTPYDVPRNRASSREGNRAGGRKGFGVDRTALIIHSLGDIAAIFLGLWILLYLLDANQANVFVDFVHGMADWLAGWSQDIFTMDTEGLRVFFNHALPAVVYLGIGHGAAAWLRRL
ncbi:hypothetical protein [Streptomyces chattanoogensis]|uniref:hypothetical protein n=1 Tax=Streptomyces chattanoogensis TaxID=66876 RepID=UPI0036C09143